MNGGDLLFACLEAHGVHDLFGMPGTQNLPIYDALKRHQNGFTHHLIRHEQNATLIANGYARASGRPGVAITVPGPGASNASTGIGDAYTDNVPVLLLTGGYTRSLSNRSRSKMFHGLEQDRFFEPITHYYGEPGTADEIPKVLDDAFRAMLTGRPGPAVVELSPDVINETCQRTPSLSVPIQQSETPLDADTIKEIAQQLSRFEKPLILLGQDVIFSSVSEMLLDLAEQLTAGIIFSRLGKGALDDHCPLVIGTCRSDTTQKLLHECDGLLAVGTRFTQIDTLGWNDTLPSSVIQLDRDPKELGREYPIQLGLAGDLSNVLPALTEALGYQNPKTSTEWAERLAKSKLEIQARKPVPVLHQIRKALPDEGIFVADVTSLAYRAFEEFPVPGPRQFLYPCHYVTLGFGFPAALGAKIACPEQPVVALCGDGGFLMTCMDLALAVEQNIPLVTVVVSDGCLTAIKGSQEKHYEGRTIATNMLVPDFASLARSFGALAHTTTDPKEITQMIEAGLQCDLPTVIEVRMEDHVDDIIDQIPWLLEK